MIEECRAHLPSTFCCGPPTDRTIPLILRTHFPGGATGSTGRLLNTLDVRPALGQCGIDLPGCAVRNSHSEVDFDSKRGAALITLTSFVSGMVRQLAAARSDPNKPTKARLILSLHVVHAFIPIFNAITD